MYISSRTVDMDDYLDGKIPEDEGWSEPIEVSDDGGINPTALKLASAFDRIIAGTLDDEKDFTKWKAVDILNNVPKNRIVSLIKYK